MGALMSPLTSATPEAVVFRASGFPRTHVMSYVVFCMFGLMGGLAYLLGVRFQVGWLLYAGLGALAFAILFILLYTRNALTAIELDEQGLVVRRVIRKQRIPWRDIRSISVEIRDSKPTKTGHTCSVGSLRFVSDSGRSTRVSLFMRGHRSLTVSFERTLDLLEALRRAADTHELGEMSGYEEARQALVEHQDAATPPDADSVDVTEAARGVLGCWIMMPFFVFGIFVVLMLTFGLRFGSPAQFFACLAIATIAMAVTVAVATLVTQKASHPRKSLVALRAERFAVVPTSPFLKLFGVRLVDSKWDELIARRGSEPSSDHILRGLAILIGHNESTSSKLSTKARRFPREFTGPITGKELRLWTEQARRRWREVCRPPGWGPILLDLAARKEMTDSWANCDFESVITSADHALVTRPFQLDALILKAASACILGNKSEGALAVQGLEEFLPIQHFGRCQSRSLFGRADQHETSCAGMARVLAGLHTMCGRAELAQLYVDVRQRIVEIRGGWCLRCISALQCLTYWTWLAAVAVPVLNVRLRGRQGATPWPLLLALYAAVPLAVIFGAALFSHLRLRKNEARLRPKIDELCERIQSLRQSSCQ